MDHDEVDVDAFADDGLDEELAAAAAAAEEAARAQRREESGAAAGDPDGTKRVKTCSYQKYKKVERSLCVYIRGAEGESGYGMRQHDVVEWYLSQQEDITNLDDLASERRLVRQIIQRLLTADKILELVETPPDEEESPAEGLRPHDTRYLTVRAHVEL